MKKFIVSYNTENFRNLQIVIWTDDRTNVRGILKKHLGNKSFTINRITQEVVNDD